MKKIITVPILIFFASLFVFGSSYVFAREKTEAKSKERSEVIVQFKNGELELVSFYKNVEIESVISAYKKNDEVLAVEQNTNIQAAFFPTDTDYGKQKYLQLVNVRPVWTKELLVRERQKVKEAIIAVMDSGVDIDHIDLKNNIWKNAREFENGRDTDRNGYVDDVYGWDFITNNKDPRPKLGIGFSEFGVHHGTIVAGIAAATSNNREGITSISWASKIMPLRVLDSQGNGTVFDVLRAINYAIDHNADVLNMSFVGTEFSLALQNKIREASEKGIVVVAAAGNNEPDNIGIDMDNGGRSYPVCLDADSDKQFIIGVGSLNNQLKRSSFSNYGSRCVDVSAPGENFYGLNVYKPEVEGFEDLYGGMYAGTSLSAPIVSGAVAIIKSFRPDLSSEKVIEIIIQSADDISVFNPGFENKIGSGNINIDKVFDNMMNADELLTKQEGEYDAIAVGLGYGSFPQVKILDKEFEEFKTFFSYAHTFNGSVSVEISDLNNDGIKEVVTAAGIGGGPHVRVLNQEGQVQNQFFAYDKRLRNGVTIAIGDIDGDGDKEIITGSGPGEIPEIKIFSHTGAFVLRFNPFESSFLGGVVVAAGDLNNDSVDEIIVGTGPGQRAFVRAFNGNTQLLGQFFAFEAGMDNGINVSSGDLNNDGRADIVVSPQFGYRPIVKVFSGGDFTQQSAFIAYSPTFLGGVNTAIGDYDGDGQLEILTGAGKGGGPHVRIFDMLGNLKDQFFAHSNDYRGGVRVGIER